MAELIEIPKRGSKAARLKKGQALKMINTHGHQVVDTWAFNAADLNEFMSMEHMRAMLCTIFPKQGDYLYTNQRRPILRMEEDTSPGIHDTLMAACDVYRYQLLGCTDYHENCTDNLVACMREIGLEAPETPSPLNMWMNIPVGTSGATEWQAPVSKPGDYVVLRAEMDCIVAMSACPQDIIPVNAGNPVEVHFEIID